MKALSKSMALAVGLALAMLATVRGDDESASKESGTKKHPCDCDVWAGLFAAHPGEPDEGAEPAEEVAEIVEQLHKAFPDHHSFRLIGDNSEKVFKEYECWIVPSRKLFLKIDSLGSHPDKSGGVHMHLQLWQEDHVLLKTDTILRRQPVFIAGPQWGEEGQLIMVLKLMKTSKQE